MKELLIVIATAMSEERIIEKIQEAISEYSQALLSNDDQKVTDAKTAISIACNLFLIREQTNGDQTKMRTFMESMNSFDRANKLFKTTKN